MWQGRPRRCEVLARSVLEPEAVGQQHDCQAALGFVVMNLNTEC